MAAPETDERAALSAACVRGRDAVLGLGPDWDDLMARAVGAPAFLARSWIEPWISEGRGRGAPVAVTVRSGSRLVALLVLDLRSVAGVRVAGTFGREVPSYQGLLLDPAHPEAVGAIADLCASEAVFHVYRNDDVSSTDDATQALVRELSSRGYRIARAHRAPCLTINLPASHETYLRENKSKKSRGNLRRAEKKLRETGELGMVHAAGADLSPEAMRRAAEVQDASWMKERGASVLSDPFYERLTMSAARAGHAQLWLMTLDGDAAAFAWGLVAHARFYLVWTAFKLRYESLNVGTTMINRTIADACEGGVGSYDFGHGDGEYKRYWSNASHDVSRVVAGRGLGGFLGVACLGLAWRLARVEWVRSLYRALRRRGGDAGAGTAAASAAREPDSSAEEGRGPEA